LVAVIPPGRVPAVGVGVAAPGVLVLVGVSVGGPGVGVLVNVFVGAGVLVGPQPGSWPVVAFTPQLVLLIGPKVTDWPRPSVILK